MTGRPWAESTPWTDDRVAELRERWAKGDSAGVIGKAMGLSRNAIVGKAYRLGLTTPGHRRLQTGENLRPKPVVVPAKPKARVAARRSVRVVTNKPFHFGAAPEQPELPRLLRPDPLGALYERPATAVHFDHVKPRQCAWPLWPNRVPYSHVPEQDRLVCGAALDTAMPYCREHRAFAYSPARWRAEGGAA